MSVCLPVWLQVDCEHGDVIQSPILSICGTLQSPILAVSGTLQPPILHCSHWQLNKDWLNVFQEFLVPTDKLISNLKNFFLCALRIYEVFSFSNSNRKNLDYRVFGCVRPMLYRTQHGKITAKFLNSCFAFPTLHTQFFLLNHYKRWGDWGLFKFK